MKKTRNVGRSENTALPVPCPPTTQALEIDMKAGSWYVQSSSAYCLLRGYNPLFVKPQWVAVEKITMSQILSEDYKSVRL